MTDRDMKTLFAVAVLATGLAASGTSLVEAKTAAPATTKVGKGYFQDTTLDITGKGLPDPGIEKSALAVSSTIAGDSVALPTSAWFSSFLRWQDSAGDLAQDALFTNPLMFAFQTGMFSRMVSASSSPTFTSTGLTMGIPEIATATSANGVLPAVTATLQDELQLLYGGSYASKAQETPPQRIDLVAYDDLLTSWTATSASGGTFTFHALQGSPFAFFEITDYPVYFNIGGGTLNNTATLTTGNAAIGGLLLTGGPRSYAVFYEIAGATLASADFSATNKVLSYTSGTTGQFVVAALPFGVPSGTPSAAQTTFISSLVSLAFNFPQSSAVQYSYDTSTGSISTTFSVTTANALTSTTGGDTMMALLPHHYTDVATADGKNPSGGLLLQNGASLAVTGDSSWTTRGDSWNVTSFDASTQTPYDTSHANPYQLYGDSAVYYYSALGPQLLVQGSSFEVQQDVIGLLPWLTLPATGTDANTRKTYKDMQEALLFRFMQGDGVQLTQYLNNDDYDGNTYSDGKQFKSWAAASIAANQLGVEAMTEYQISDTDLGTTITLADATDRALKKYFSEDPDTTWVGQTSKKRFFTYDAELNALLGFPAGFGSTEFLNDHNLTFGYFARSASALAAYSPFGLTDWLLADKYADVIDQLVYDVANPFTEDAMSPQASARYACSDTTCGGLFSGTFTKNNRLLNGATDPSFPFQRNYDAFGGIGWASGLVTDGRTSGPNTESVSESLNAIAAFVLRAGQTGNKDLFVASLAQWVTQIATSNAYWMDMDGYYSSFTNYPSMAQMGDFGTVVAPGNIAQSDFFDGTPSPGGAAAALNDPEALRGITVFPVGPQSFYLSKNQTYTKHAYEAARDYARTFGNSLWNVILTEWEASFDPASAAIDLNNAFQNEISFSGGKKTQTVTGSRSPIKLDDCLSGKVTTTASMMVTQVCSDLTGLAKIGGNSFLEIYRWVQFQVTYGTAKFDYTANTPFAVVLDNGGTLSFVAYNPSATSQTITFYLKGTAVTNLTGLTLAAQTLQIYDSSGTAQLGATHMMGVTADSVIARSYPASNEGANPILSVGSGSGGFRRTLLAFDGDEIGDYLASHDLTSATLILTVAADGSPSPAVGQAIEARPLVSEFEEGNGRIATLARDQQDPGSGTGVTWRCALDSEIGDRHPNNCLVPWSSRKGGGDLAEGLTEPVLVADGVSSVVRFDVTDDVLSGFQSWAVKKVLEVGYGELLFHSSEGAADAGEPRLAPRLVLQGELLE